MRTNHLVIIAAAAILASCAQDGMLNTLEQGNNTYAPISFGIYTEKATRANTEGLNTYHTQFVVFGTKTYTFNGVTEPVFSGDTVRYDNVKNSWRYDDLRYWESGANYGFAAIAPSAKYIKYSKADNVRDTLGVYCTKDGGYTLLGTNLQNGTRTAEVNNGFTGAGDTIDTDLMIAPVNLQKGVKHDESVSLIFQHILAKVNIAIRKTAAMKDEHIYIKKVAITGLDNHGTYSKREYTGVTSGWTASTTDSTYTIGWNTDSKLDSLELPYYEGNEFTYYVESMVMPQAIKKDTIGAQALHLEYYINKQRYSFDRYFRYDETLKNVAGQDSITVERALFSSFMDRNKYNILLTIDPEVIILNVEASGWIANDTTISVIKDVNKIQL